MLMVYLSAVLTLALFLLSLFGIADAAPGFILSVSAVLWLTVLFANFAEALAEGRGKAQADALREAKRDVEAHKLNEGLLAKGHHVDDPAEFFRIQSEEVDSAILKKKDLFFVMAGEQIPADGEIEMGAASVDESAITGESAPVIREAGGDRSAVTGGTTVLSDWLVVRVTAERGNSFLDQMIAMVESAARKKTPNEIALQIHARGAHYRVPYRGGVAVCVQRVRCKPGRRGEPHLPHVARRAVRVPGAHHYRSAAFQPSASPA